MHTEARLSHISNLAQNARSTWLGLLGLLIFVGITTMAHKDSDFFAHGASTTLPIINVEVPTDAFFVAAPVLIAAFYCYMNIFLFGLWDALGRIDQAPPDPETGEMTPLAELIVPTIFTIAGLWYRNHVRRDGSMSARILGIWTVIIALLLGWVFCWVILGFVWWRSMPAHDLLVTVIAAVCLWVTVDVGIYAVSAARTQLGNRKLSKMGVRPIRIAGSIAVFATLIVTSYGRAQGFDRLFPVSPQVAGFLTKLIPLSRADLREAQLSVKPKEWLAWEDWRKEMRSEFARREAINAPFSDWSVEQKFDFDNEARRRWRALTLSLDHESLETRDLRGADLSFAFLVGVDLENADLTGAILKGADASGAVFRAADMQNVDLSSALLQGANLSRANLEGVSFESAQMQWSDLGHHWSTQDGEEPSSLPNLDPTLLPPIPPFANFASAELEGADLSDLDLRKANFSGAGLQDANLSSSLLQGADFSYASLTGTRFEYAKLEGVNFWKARLNGVNFTKADLTSAHLAVYTIQKSFLFSADLSDASTNLTQEDFDNTFGDGGTILPEGFQPPCHWPEHEAGHRFVAFYLKDWTAGEIPVVARRPDGTCPDKP